MRWKLFVGLAASFAALGLLTTGGRSDPPVKGKPKKLEDRVFVPHAGYLRTTLLNYLKRQAAASSPAFAHAAGATVKGERSLPVICVEFKNRAAPFPTADYQTMLFSDPKSPAIRPTLTQYYRDISGGRLNVTGSVVGWYKLPEDDTFYENGANGDGPPFGELLQLALEKADAEIDFGQFDNDGPDGIPNSGDDDGKVDTVFFIHPEVGAEAQGGCPAAKGNIWSHSWHYSEPGFGHTGPFVTKAIRKDSAGNPVLNPDGSPQRIVAEDYTIQPALACTGPRGAAKIIEVGVFCHEYGHAIGLPDLYDRTPAGDVDSQGVGNWCLMAGGSYGGDGDHAELPTHMSAWSKAFLGWADVETVTGGRSLALEPVEDRAKVYRFNVPGTNRQEYFLVEYRSKDWSDPTGQRINWDKFLPATGLAIWHIDERVGKASPNWPFAAPDQGQNDSPYSPGGLRRPLVRLVQADRRMDLERIDKGRGDSTDVWTTGAFDDDPTFVAGSRGYDKKKTGITLTGIDLAGGILLAKSGEATTGPTKGIDLAQLQDLLHVPIADNVVSAEALAGLRSKLHLGAGALSTAERDSLARLQPEQLRNVFSGRSLAFARDAANLARTSKLSGPAADSPLGKRLASALGSSNAENVTVVESPSRLRVERITGLALPSDGRSPAEDAMSRLQKGLVPLIGEGVKFAPHALPKAAAPPQSAGTAERFEQTVRVNDKTLPVFGTEATLHYNKAGNLTAMTSKVQSPEKLKVGPVTVSLSLEEAQGIVKERLGLLEVNLKQGREGVFLVGNDPGKGRPAYEFSLPAGTYQRAIHVYLDQQTREVLDIK